MIYKKFTLLFFAITALHLFLLSGNNLLLIGFSKNLILTSLIVFWIRQTALQTRTDKWIFAALIFCFLGDLVLQFSRLAEIYFILGLASFLIAHVCYSIGFLAESDCAIRFNGRFIQKSIGPILAGVAMVWLLWAHLGGLKIPVLLYAFCIAGMAAIALNRAKNMRASYILVAAGAGFFIISDAVLAYNKFVVEIKFASYIIMATYAVANFLLVIGLLKKHKKVRIS